MQQLWDRMRRKKKAHHAIGALPRARNNHHGASTNASTSIWKQNPQRTPPQQPTLLHPKALTKDQRRPPGWRKHMQEITTGGTPPLPLHLARQNMQQYYAH